MNPVSESHLHVVKPAAGGLDVARARSDFPILRQRVHGRPLVYLDNAATTQKPAAVIEALDRYYRFDNANVHRGLRGRARNRSALYPCARHEGNRIYARRHRGHQPRGPGLGRGQRPSGRRDPGLRDGASLQHRAVADAVRADRRQSQGYSHQRRRRIAIGCDFYVFSGHKLYGPTGIGVLYGKEALLDAMPPWHGGGEMVKRVSFEKTIYADLPAKFEAGTPPIAGAVGLGAAVDYVMGLGLGAIAVHERELLAYATQRVAEIPELRIIGTAREKSAVLSFSLGRIHPHDIGTLLDRQGVAIRAGHHCAMPVMRHYGVPATARASFAVYNTRADIDALTNALHKVIEVFR